IRTEVGDAGRLPRPRREDRGGPPGPVRPVPVRRGLVLGAKRPRCRRSPLFYPGEYQAGCARTSVSRVRLPAASGGISGGLRPRLSLESPPAGGLWIHVAPKSGLQL